MGGGVLFAKALIALVGMDPKRDVKIVVASEGAQTAAMVRDKQVDALCQFDTQYALVENAGVKLRLLEAKEIDRFPGNGFLALEDTLRNHRREAIALARGYAKGTIFAIANPEAAVRILYEAFPGVRPTGKDEATAVHDDTKMLQARIPNWVPGHLRPPTLHRSRSKSLRLILVPLNSTTITSMGLSPALTSACSVFGGLAGSQ